MKLAWLVKGSADLSAEPAAPSASRISSHATLSSGLERSDMNLAFAR